MDLVPFSRAPSGRVPSPPAPGPSPFDAGHACLPAASTARRAADAEISRHADRRAGGRDRKNGGYRMIGVPSPARKREAGRGEGSSDDIQE